MFETAVENPSSGYVVSSTQVIGRSLADVARWFPDLCLKGDAGRMPVDLKLLGSPQRETSQLDLSLGKKSANPSLLALRSYLTEAQGKGYWDFFMLSPNLFLSVTDAVYKQDTWIDVPGDRIFKIRLLLSGTLEDKAKRITYKGPDGILYALPGAVNNGYYVAAGEQIKMVVLHCKPEILSEVLLLGREEVPMCLGSLFNADAKDAKAHCLGVIAEVFRIAAEIVASRYQYTQALRHCYLEAKCHEILCAVIQALNDQDFSSNKGLPQTTKRDLRRIYEARDILLQHYADPPTIPRLSRMVGMSQTKLKASFKAVLGVTLYDFVHQCRMDKASELLRSGEFSISEVAYEIGYDYPANFTQAFKKYYGFLPKALKQRS